MDHGHLPPLDDIAIVGLLLMATVAFDCSGARFTEDVDEEEARLTCSLTRNRPSSASVPDAPGGDVNVMKPPSRLPESFIVV